MRRLLLSAIIAIFRRGESIQPVFGFFICFIYASLVGAAAPYVDSEDDFLARCSSQIIVLVYFVTHARCLDMSEERDATKDTYRQILFLVGVVAPLALIALVRAPRPWKGSGVICVVRR